MHKFLASLVLLATLASGVGAYVLSTARAHAECQSGC